MANRHTLAITSLEDFKEWLISKGWQIEPTKGYYEVLRARHKDYKYPLIIHKKSDATMHLSIDERQLRIYKQYFNEKKGKGNERHKDICKND